MRTEYLDIPYLEWPPKAKCSHFDSCSVGQCPIDPNMMFAAIVTGPDGDPEQKCHVTIAVRERWLREAEAEGNKWVKEIPFAGLTPAEHSRREAGRKRWAAMSEEDRLERVSALKEAAAERAARRAQG